MKKSIVLYSTIIIFFTSFSSCVRAQTIKQKTVLLDNYFNNEWKKDDKGNRQRFHYLWSDTAQSGFSIWGKSFKKEKAILSTLETAPTHTELAKATVYIIVDPDNIKDNPEPHYMTESDATTIESWVKKGGVLVLMANDSINCDLQHFNILASKFGIIFTNHSTNMVKNDSFPMGDLLFPKENEIFYQTKKVFMKDVSVLKVSNQVNAFASKNDEIIIAIAKYGKGTVFAVGDPWLYNEYTNGRLPADYQNSLAADELAHWLLMQSKLSE